MDSFFLSLPSMHEYSRPIKRSQQLHDLFNQIFPYKLTERYLSLIITNIPQVCPNRTRRQEGLQTAIQTCVFLDLFFCSW